MFKDSPEGQTQYEPAAPEPLGDSEGMATQVVAGLEPVAWYMAVATEHTPPSTYAHVSWGNKPDDNIHTEPLYSAATVERLVQERDANAAYFEAYHRLRVAVNAAYPQDPYQLAEDVPALMQQQLAAMTQERDEQYAVNKEMASHLVKLTQERDDYRAALEYKSKREEALKARDLKCACDHNEYCSKCFPLDFREGGMFYETPDSVMRNALAKYPRKADELEGKK